MHLPTLVGGNIVSGYKPTLHKFKELVNNPDLLILSNCTEIGCKSLHTILHT